MCMFLFFWLHLLRNKLYIRGASGFRQNPTNPLWISPAADQYYVQYNNSEAFVQGHLNSDRKQKKFKPRKKGTLRLSADMNTWSMIRGLTF